MGGALALLAGICVERGRIGELSRSKVSTACTTGGDFDRRGGMLGLAGSVCDRCIGPLTLRFVTLDGSSGKTGEGDFCRARGGTVAVVLGASGDDDNRSMASSGVDRDVGAACVFADARASCEPGFVTFAKRLMGA